MKSAFSSFNRKSRRLSLYVFWYLKNGSFVPFNESKMWKRNKIEQNSFMRKNTSPAWGGQREPHFWEKFWASLWWNFEITLTHHFFFTLRAFFISSISYPKSLGPGLKREMYVHLKPPKIKLPFSGCTWELK